ncbi:MAG: transketolase [Firmicutes bacterium]|nr:transketolase [Bacillota bacterium]MCL1953436.1 transketolase [Bacillota bacterium]
MEKTSKTTAKIQFDDIDQLCANTLRVLGIEAIQQANSGHPGIVLGAAPLAYALWSKAMSHNPKDSKWQNRDRFVLSAGHGSALLYSLLCVFDYDVSLDDLKSFRQLGSKTPGHPEFGHTDGVETSTGPLGQGFCNAVGMAQAESILAAKFNKTNANIVDHYTYCIAGDGCLMEGISYEAASLAGLWKLNKLIVLYDSNNISIEGNTNIAFKDDVKTRFESMGWFVQSIDGFDMNQVLQAIKKSKSQNDKPSIIICKTIIGWGSAKENSEKSHGSPLGVQGVIDFKQKINWQTPEFTIPKVVKERIKQLNLQSTYKKWITTLKKYEEEFPQEYLEYCRWMQGKDNFNLYEDLDNYNHTMDSTRNVSGKILNILAKSIPNLYGGSADLASSNKTTLVGFDSYQANNRLGRNFHYGVREHAMIAISNGMILHGGIVNYVSTFLVFSDYAKGAIRMASIMNLPSLFIFTHDSIGVGEDGGTHQPIEHLASLRSIPNLKVFRPCDSRETVVAYKSWLKDNSPYALILSRQDLPLIEGSSDEAVHGGYVISQSLSTPTALLLATGSEVQIAIQAQKILEQNGIYTSVISMPCQELFDLQADEYKSKVLPNNIRARIAIESASSMSWYKYVGLDGKIIGLDSFGLSGKDNDLFKYFGFTIKNIVDTTTDLVNTIFKKY